MTGTSLAGATHQSEKNMLWIYGANHNFFNTVWTPGFGFACASDDGSGEGRISAPLQRMTACQSIVPFFELHLQDKQRLRRVFQGERPPEGLDGVEMYWTHQHPQRLDLDHFDVGDNPNTNSLAGPVTTSGGFTTFDEFEFKSFGPDVFDPSFRHHTHGLVLGWNSLQTYETVIPAGHRDVSSFKALVLRASQILDGGVLNPLDTPRTLRVALRTTAGTLSNVDFDAAGLQSIPYPYEYNGGKTVLGMLRVPLKHFRDGTKPLDLQDVEAVVLEFKGTGLIAVDDLQFSK